MRRSTTAAAFTRELNAVNAEVRVHHADEIAAVEALIEAAEAEIAQMRQELAAVADPMREQLTALTNRMREELTALADRMHQEMATLSERLREEGERVAAPMREALERLVAPMQWRVEEINSNLRDLAQPLINKMQAELNAAVPKYDWPQPIAQEDDNPLYDSKRGYLDQLDRYHEHQGKAKLTKLRNCQSYPHVCTNCGKKFMSIKRDQELCRGCKNNQSRRERRQREAAQKG
jgi:hypothetical protein